MLEYIAIEIIKAIGKFFLNPLIYWIIFITFVISKRRTKDEQMQFQRELFPVGAEFKHTGKITILGSLFVSVIAIFLNVTFIHEIVLFLSIVIFILSFAFGFRLLSAVYTLSITFILFKLLELYDNRLFELGFITNHTFSSMALLIALFLFVEAALYKIVTNENSFPEIQKSKRGSLFGIHHVQKATVVPFFVFIPGEITIGSLPVIPYFTIGGENISFAFVPFIIGFHHIVTTQLPVVVAQKLKKNNRLLALLILIIALVSFYLPGIAVFAIAIAVIGKLYINYVVERDEPNREMTFLELNNELKILAIVPDSPAHKLGLKVGDLITKVNDIEVTTLEELNEELDSLIRYPNFEVISCDRQVRQVENSKYRGNLFELGIIFLKNKGN